MNIENGSKWITGDGVPHPRRYQVKDSVVYTIGPTGNVWYPSTRYADLEEFEDAVGCGTLVPLTDRVPTPAA
jgi:hypothetical protein